LPDKREILPKIKIKKERIFLEWSNINYNIKLKKNKNKIRKDEIKPLNKLDDELSNINDDNTKTILTSIDGFAMPNELLAIMGPSGCGKTSLLNILADRQLRKEKNHKITRIVKANNIPMSQSNFGKICAYIMQEDILMDCLTPRESLIFGARLRLKSSKENIMKRVERLINQVQF
jgi:ABC-type multidrug transport system ATPase subunit